MYYKIQKSLGRLVAVQVESIPEKGICVVVNNFKSRDVNILIYQDCKLDDLQINGWTIPYCFNDISFYLNEPCCINNKVIDPTGCMENVSIHFGYNESKTVEQFYTALFRLSCCENIKQYKELSCIMDPDRRYNNELLARMDIDFIDSFMPHLSNLKDTNFLEELINDLNNQYNRAKAYLSSSES